MWTYAAGLSDDYDYKAYNCPCATIPGPIPPAFVGNDYYCESGDVGTQLWHSYHLYQTHCRMVVGVAMGMLNLDCPGFMGNHRLQQRKISKFIFTKMVQWQVLAMKTYLAIENFELFVL